MHHKASATSSALHATAPPTACQAGTLRIVLFAGMADAAGSRDLRITWSGGTAASLRRRLAEELPSVAALVSRSVVAIGDAYVTDEADVPTGAEVAIIPPVSGG